MIKKYIFGICVASSLLYAEMDQKGFFVGVDFGVLNSKTKYQKKGMIITTSNYDSIEKNHNILSFKAGYQAYFTRVYAKIENFETYNDSLKQRYSIRNRTLEICIDYIPVFFKNKKNQWNVRGVFGVGFGTNRANLDYFDARLDTTPSMLNRDSQQSVEYGAQIGFLIENSYGFNAEIGLRYRNGNLLQFQDENQNEIIFSQETNEYYFGFNYLF